jgi:hypothetical protein
MIQLDQPVQVSLAMVAVVLPLVLGTSTALSLVSHWHKLPDNN